MAIQPDGKIVAIGTGFNVARYRPNGTLDPTFSGDGKASASFDPRLGQDSHAGVLQPDGKIVAAGYFFDSSGQGNYDFALVRFTASGALDATFDGDGRVTTDFGLSAMGERILGLAIQADGKLVAVGDHPLYIPPGGSQPTGGHGWRQPAPRPPTTLTSWSPDSLATVRWTARSVATASCHTTSVVATQWTLHSGRTAGSWRRALATPRATSPSPVTGTEGT